MLIGLSSSHLWTRRAYWFGQVGTLTSSGVTAQITFQWQLISAFNLLAFEQTADFFINGYSALATSMVGVPCHHVKANGTESWVQAWIGHSPRKKTRWIHNGIEFVPGEESAEFIVRSCASTATNNTGACLCDQNWPSYKVELLLFDLCNYHSQEKLIPVGLGYIRFLQVRYRESVRIEGPVEKNVIFQIVHMTKRSTQICYS